MTQQTAAIPPGTPLAWHGLGANEALHEQAVDPLVGLSAAEVEARRATFGPNKFAEAKKEPGSKLPSVRTSLQVCQ